MEGPEEKLDEEILNGDALRPSVNSETHAEKHNLKYCQWGNNYSGACKYVCICIILLYAGRNHKSAEKNLSVFTAAILSLMQHEGQNVDDASLT